MNSSTTLTMQASASTISNTARPLMQARGERDFRSLFGTIPEVCAAIWNRLVFDDESPLIRPVHLLWALMFMKLYSKEAALCKLARVSRSTFRKFVWFVIPRIAHLKSDVVCFLFAPFHCYCNSFLPFLLAVSCRSVWRIDSGRT